MMSLRIQEADLSNGEHQQAVVELLDAYARDVTAGGQGLADDVRSRVAAGLHEHTTAFVLLAWNDDVPVGIAVCLIGFSTFAARRTINIHDLGVLQNHRGQGIGRKLIEHVVAIGREIDCCKLTLEVERSNPALRLYESTGFRTNDHLDSDATVLFLERKL